MPVVPRRQSGSQTPNANAQTRAVDVFGRSPAQQQRLAFAPIEAFGDNQGQLAIANALRSAGDSFFDVGMREAALRRSEEETDIGKKLTDLNVREVEIRQEIEREQETTFRTPDEKHSAYIERMDKAQEEILGGKEYQYFKPETVNKEVTTLRKKRELEYRGGKLEQDRLDTIRANSIDTLQKTIDQAAVAGRENAPTQFAAIIDSIKEQTNNARFMAAVGPAAAQEYERKAVGQAVHNFVREAAERDPEGARAMLENPDSELIKLVGKESINAMREDLDDIITGEEREKQMELDKQREARYGDMYLGIQDVRSSTGKPTTRTEILNDKLLTDMQKAQLLNSLDADRASKNAAYAKAVQTQAIINAGGTLADIPTSQDDVDAWYSWRVNALSNQPPEVRQQILGQEIAQLGKTPTMYVAVLQGHLTRGNNEQRRAAASQIMALFKANPRLIDQFPETTQYMAATIDSGVNPQDAADNLKRSTQMTVVERKMWEEAASETLKKDAKEMMVDTTRTGLIFKTTPIDQDDIPIGAENDFNNMYKENLKKTQDPEAAKSLTQAQWARKWQKTEIDGRPRLMIHAPEQAYGEWTNKALELEMKAQGYRRGEYKVEYNPASKPGRPTYNIVILKEGEFAGLLSDDNGSPFVWIPEFKAYQQLQGNELDEIKKLEADVLRQTAEAAKNPRPLDRR